MAEINTRNLSLNGNVYTKVKKFEIQISSIQRLKRETWIEWILLY